MKAVSIAVLFLFSSVLSVTALALEDGIYECKSKKSDDGQLSYRLEVDFLTVLVREYVSNKKIPCGFDSIHNLSNGKAIEAHRTNLVLISCLDSYVDFEGRISLDMVTFIFDVKKSTIFSANTLGSLSLDRGKTFLSVGNSGIKTPMTCTFTKKEDVKNTNEEVK